MEINHDALIVGLRREGNREMTEKCICGHSKKSHNSVLGLIGAGLRLYLDCKFCDYKKYKPKKQSLSVEEKGEV